MVPESSGALAIGTNRGLLDSLITNLSPHTKRSIILSMALFAAILCFKNLFEPLKFLFEEYRTEAVTTGMFAVEIFIMLGLLLGFVCFTPQIKNHQVSQHAATCRYKFNTFVWLILSEFIYISTLKFLFFIILKEKQATDVRPGAKVSPQRATDTSNQCVTIPMDSLNKHAWISSNKIITYFPKFQRAYTLIENLNFILHIFFTIVQ